MADKADASIELARLERAVRSLETKPREVFLMFSLEGLDYIEIGRRVGMSVREVESQVAAAFYHLSCVLHCGEGSGGEQSE
jgi:DNA-directed RNA polymerase specialized sigma24 family protein